EVVEIFERLKGASDQETIAAHNNLGAARLELSEYPAARQSLERATNTSVERLGQRNYLTLLCQSNLAASALKATVSESSLENLAQWRASFAEITKMGFVVRSYGGKAIEIARIVYEGRTIATALQMYSAA